MRNRGSPFEARGSPALRPRDPALARKQHTTRTRFLVRFRLLLDTAGRTLGQLRQRQRGATPLFVLLQACIAGCILWLALSAAFQHAGAGRSTRQRHRHGDTHFRVQRSPGFVPNWRNDSRCGSGFPSPDGGRLSVCDPFGRACCCSAWGWCGAGNGFCKSALLDFRNHTAAPGAVRCSLDNARSWGAQGAGSGATPEGSIDHWSRGSASEHR